MNKEKELTTYDLALLHHTVIYNLTRENEWFLNDKNYDKYYSRLLPVIKGEYPCPTCLKRHNLLNDLVSGRVDTNAFLSHGEKYLQYIHTSEKNEKLAELRAMVSNLYDIDLKVYYDINELHQRGALKAYRTDPSVLYHKIDPVIYFGLLVLHHREKAAPSAVATSEKTIALVFQTYHRMQAQEGNLLSYVTRNYITSQQEQIFDALNSGENIVEQTMQNRGLDRWDALTYCVDFGMVTDLYAVACKEFKARGEELIFYRKRLRSFADTHDNAKITTLKATIEAARKLFYDQNKREYVKPKGFKHPKRKGKPNLKQQYYDAGM